MDHRAQRLELETDRYRIVGILTLPREGYLSRLSDYLNQSELEFLSLTDATLVPLAGGEPRRQRFVSLSRRHVRLVVPVDEGPER